MKLCLLSSSFVVTAALLSLSALGCSGASNPSTGPDGGVNGLNPGSSNEPPHALGTILLGESHVSGLTASASAIAVSFVPDASMASSCTTTLAGGCTMPMTATCNGQNGAPLCNANQVCTLGTNCAPQCVFPCTATCENGQECYVGPNGAQSCQAIQTFDAGALAFAGTATSLTLFPPYSFDATTAAAEGQTLFLSGKQIEVQAAGATGAGFQPFDETFTATTLVQTPPPSLAKMDVTTVFGRGDLPIQWVPAQPPQDSIIVSVTGPMGTAECPALDAAGTFSVARSVIDAVTGVDGTTSLSFTVTRKRVEEKKDAKTKGTLANATVQPIGFLDLTTTSSESASFDCPTGTCLPTNAPPSCSSGYTQCADGCQNLLASNTDCGGCGNVCPSGYSCSEGGCYANSGSCSTGYTMCSGSCVDTNTSTSNCGYCGYVCPSGESCQSGVCTGTTTTCSSCESTAESGTCSSYYSTCVNDTNCTSYDSCLSGCASGDTTCQSGCSTSYPTGSSEYASLKSCLCNSACFSECESDPSCTN